MYTIGLPGKWVSVGKSKIFYVVAWGNHFDILHLYIVFKMTDFPELKHAFACISIFFSQKCIFYHLPDFSCRDIQWVLQTHTFNFSVFSYQLIRISIKLLYYRFLMLLVHLSTGSTCEQPYVPVNANFSCSKEEKGLNCTLVCRDGYSLTQNAVHSYFCPNNGRWEPARTPDRPDCSRECPPTDSSLNFSASCCCSHWAVGIHFICHISLFIPHTTEDNLKVCKDCLLQSFLLFREQNSQ